MVSRSPLVSALFAPSLLAISLFAGCGDKEPAQESPPPADDTAIGEDTDDTSVAPSPPEGCALAAMAPLTVSSIENTEVTWTIECSDPADGDAGSWTVEVPGMGAQEAKVAPVEGGFAITSTAGGRLTVGRNLVKLRFEDQDLLELPLRVHQPTDVAIAEIAAKEVSWNAYDATPQEVSSGPEAMDTDDDGLLDTVLAFGLDEKGSTSAMVLDTATGVWTTHAGKGLVSAPDEAGPGAVAFDGQTIASAQVFGRKKPEILVQEWDALLQEYVSEVIESPIYAEEVVGVNPLHDGRVAMLGLGGDAIVYWNGEKQYSQASLVGVGPSDASSGQAAIGLFATIDTRAAGAPAASEMRAWVLDGRAVVKGGALELAVVDPATGARYRSLEVGKLSFTPEALTAAPFDIDGDGAMDLVVEAWGQGEHAAFWVANAADKSETRGAVELQVKEGGGVAWSSPSGEPVAVNSSFVFAGGLLVAEELRPSSEGVVHVARVWTASGVAAGNGAALKSLRLGKLSGGLLGKAKGMAGGSTMLRPVMGGGNGAASAADPELVSGDIVAIAPGSDAGSLLITRAVYGDTTVEDEVVAVDPTTCEPALRLRDGGGTLSIHGGSIVLTDESTVTIGNGSSFLVSGFGGADCSGECSLSIEQKGGIVGTWDFDDQMAQDLRVIGEDPDGNPIVNYCDPVEICFVGVADAEVLAAGSFKGRGPIQLTGRANYAAAGKALGGDPGLASTFTPGAAADVEAGALIAVRTIEEGWGVKSACPVATTLVDIAAPSATPVVMDTADNADCSDLFVPVATLRGVPGAKLAVLMANSHSVRVDVLADGHVNWGASMEIGEIPGWDPTASNWSDSVSVADLDGDGIEDVMLDLGGGQMVLIADGAGGFTMVDTAGDLANIAGIVGAGPGLGSCFDAAGGLGKWTHVTVAHDAR